MDNKDDVGRLSDILAFFEKHPNLPVPCGLDLVVATKDELITAARLPGAKKEYDTTYFYVIVPIAPDVSMKFFCSRETVCRPIETVEIVVPARPQTTRREVVEWECHPLLKPDVDATPRGEEVPL